MTDVAGGTPGIEAQLAEGADGPADGVLHGSVDAEEVAFLRRSLTDLEEEWAAGDLDDEDHARLRDEYTTRLARALRGEPEDGPPAAEAVASETDAVAPARTGEHRWLRPAVWGLLVVALAVVAGLLVARSSGSRTSGQALTGEIRQPVDGQLAQCAEMSQGGDVVGAVKCYDGVLKDQPSSVEALTYRGWTLARTGVASLLQVASQNLDQAVSLDPSYADARVFRAVVRRDLGRIDDARADLAAFDALNPPQLMRTLVDQMGLRDSLR